MRTYAALGEIRVNGDDGACALALEQGLDLRQVGVLQHVQQLAVVIAHFLCSGRRGT